MALGVSLGIETSTWLKKLAVMLAVVGTLVSLDFGTMDFGSALGAASLLLNAVCLSAWLLMQRRLLDKGHAVLPLTAAMYAEVAVSVASRRG